MVKTIIETEGPEVIGGRYRLEAVIGRGGAGVVYAATHLVLEQPVAIKALRADVIDNPEARARFLREARLATRLHGPHVTRVFDAGILDDGRLYLAMERLAGTDLATALARSGPLPVPVACLYILQACEALAEAHAARIVHRDLKPANLFLTRALDGSPLIKVLDFGIAKGDTDGAPAVTTTLRAMGTPAYMAPEQLRASREVDHRCDIWALGIVLHELVTGERPFGGSSFAEVCARVARDPTPRIRTVERGSRLPQIVARCLEREPAARYQNAVELACALAPIVGDGGAAIARRCARLAKIDDGALVMQPRPRRWPWVAAALSAAAALGLAVAATSEPDRPPAPEPVVPTAFPLVVAYASPQAPTPPVFSSEIPVPSEPLLRQTVTDVAQAVAQGSTAEDGPRERRRRSRKERLLDER